MARVVEREADVLGPPVDSWVSVHYRIDPARPDERPPAGARTEERRSSTVYLVEEVQVRPEAAPDYMEGLEALYLPITRSLGMDLVSVWHTPVGIGEDVTVMTTFRIPDWQRWDELRGRLVASPAMPGWLKRKRELVVGGRRRFYQQPEGRDGRRPDGGRAAAGRVRGISPSSILDTSFILCALEPLPAAKPHKQ
jgi:hypothetical protein